MTHKHCFEAVDRILGDILRFSNSDKMNLPFGGKVMVLGGDFRQILPVISKGTRQKVVHASINSSYLWDYCQVLALTKNTRLQTRSSDADVNRMKQFSNWLLNIGEEDDGNIAIQILDDMLITNPSDPLASIVDSTYPSFVDNMSDPSFFRERAILAQKNDIVDMVNDYMLALCPGEAKTYLSFDTPCSLNENLELKLKVSVPIMLLRNINQSSGLCNGTRLLITWMGRFVLEAKIISGSNIGQKDFIPILSSTSSDNRIPFRFQRKQFSIVVSSAMTINKSQGQSLKHVGIYLAQSVFTHGQLYVAISKVTSHHGLKILIIDNKGEVSNVTSNVVYKEIFQNLH